MPQASDDCAVLGLNADRLCSFCRVQAACLFLPSLIHIPLHFPPKLKLDICLVGLMARLQAVSDSITPGTVSGQDKPSCEAQLANAVKD